VFLLLLQIAVLLATARLLGEIMRKLKQPAVIGELIAGVVLGPSVLGALAPEVQASSSRRCSTRPTSCSPSSPGSACCS
jgi:Kef-type K+ transport system membrane component KefB